MLSEGILRIPIIKKIKRLKKLDGGALKERSASCSFDALAPGCSQEAK